LIGICWNINIENTEYQWNQWFNNMGISSLMEKMGFWAIQGVGDSET